MTQTRQDTPNRLTTSKPTTRHVTIGNQQLRVDVRAGNGTGTPLLMCCGIGASFEVLQPLVDALDPGIDIIRFDVPGVGGSPVAALPHTFPQLARSWPGCSIGCWTSWVITGSTSWASPGAARSRSNSPSNTPDAAAGWC